MLLKLLGYPNESISCGPFGHVEEVYDIYATWRCHRRTGPNRFSLAPSSPDPVYAARAEEFGSRSCPRNHRLKLSRKSSGDLSSDVTSVSLDEWCMS
jgi:hypothetical protein